MRTVIQENTDKEKNVIEDKKKVYYSIILNVHVDCVHTSTLAKHFTYFLLHLATYSCWYWKILQWIDERIRLRSQQRYQMHSLCIVTVLLSEKYCESSLRWLFVQKFSCSGPIQPQERPLSHVCSTPKGIHCPALRDTVQQPYRLFLIS